MTTALAVTLFLLLLAGVSALLERNHRRTRGQPTLPLGADPACDADLWRLRHDLDVARPRGARRRTAPARDQRPNRQVHRARVA